MMIGRVWYSALLGVLAIAPVAVAAVAAEPKESVRASGDTDIVVTAASAEDLSGWKRAETDHVVVFSDGGERELADIATRLEGLHALMSRLYRTTGQGRGTPKLQVMLFGSRDDLVRLGLRNRRSAEGPFIKDFSDQRFFDPRIDGPMLALVRDDQIIDLDTKMARDRFCEDLAEAGADCVGQTEPSLPPVARPWETVLYSAFAQSFLLSNVPAAYPRWYLDGVGALFSTVDIRKDGTIEYARPPANYRHIFRSYGEVSAREVLTGSYLDAPSQRMAWTPYHAWLITHYFVFSNPKAERQTQFARYMAAIGRGATPAEAAEAFGDLGRADARDQILCLSRKKAFARTRTPEAPPQAPSVTALSKTQLAVQEARVRLGDPVPDAVPEAGETASRPPWIDQLRGASEADAVLVAAEAESPRGHDQANVWPMQSASWRGCREARGRWRGRGSR
ncbi:hypothetical protein [Sphingopyxis sp. PET50]|uniref:hypothetical protein n=1 Tax=Sphingopyxis sp. PET50 TaxID=2976533 RepID=UPI0021AF581F|nr:hypothetical protein [Sphingopyxis sp. PET50]